MAEIRFRKNNTEYHLDYRSIDIPCEQRLAFRYNGDTYYVPAMSTQGTKVLGGTVNGSSWYYDTSSPTIAFRKNGKTYYCSKSCTNESYDIPAGTYTPSAFKKLIESFISHNGSRAVKNSFKVTVNGQTLSLAAGTTIHYTTQGSSPWYARAVGFGERYFQVASCMDKTGFTLYKSYIVETSNSNSNATGHCDVSFNIAFRYYASFNITVETGIKFK